MECWLRPLFNKKDVWRVREGYPSILCKESNCIRGIEGELIHVYGFLFSSYHTQYYGNGHPIDPKWPHYRSCCTPIDFVYSSLPVALVPIQLPKSLSAVCFFRDPPRHLNTMETSSCVYMLNCHRRPEGGGGPRGALAPPPPPQAMAPPSPHPQ